jgi:tetratricopeptide (TPR) repeat protein
MKKYQRALLIVVLPLMASIAVLFSPLASAGQESRELLTNALQLQEKQRESESLAFFEQVLQAEPDNYQALLNAAHLHLRQGWLYSEKEKRKEHYLALQTYAGRALDLKPSEYQARFLVIVGKAKMARYLSPGDQVRIARELQTDLAALSTLMQDDPNGIYILSWLNFKVGTTSALEKLLASVLFGGLPDNLTIDNAFALMEKAIRLRPDYLVYHYDIGLYRQRLGEVDKAQPWFEKVLDMEAKTAEEAVYKQWAKQRLLELAGQKVASN